MIIISMLYIGMKYYFKILDVHYSCVTIDTVDVDSCDYHGDIVNISHYYKDIYRGCN